MTTMARRGVGFAGASLKSSLERLLIMLRRRWRGRRGGIEAVWICKEESSSINETGNVQLESSSSCTVLNEECKEADISASNDDEDSEGKETGDGTSSVAIEESTATADTGDKPQINKIPASEGIALLSQRRAPKRGRNARKVNATPVVTTAHDNSHQKKKGKGKSIRNWLRDTRTDFVRGP
ncbi:hypothetical protein SK128_021534, partial [Halocaridina rubra]